MTTAPLDPRLEGEKAAEMANDAHIPIKSEKENDESTEGDKEEEKKKSQGGLFVSLTQELNNGFPAAQWLTG